MTQSSTATTLEVTALLTVDHREILGLLARVPEATEAEQRRDLADTAIAEIMRHSVAEEMFLYPVINERLPNGAADVEHDRQEHDELVQVMKQIEGAEASGEEFLSLVGRLEDLLEQHAEEKEDDQFPKLRIYLSREQLNEVGEQVDTAMKAAPTRPHPTTPDTELFHKTIEPGVGMVDRLRDTLLGRETN